MCVTLLLLTALTQQVSQDLCIASDAPSIRALSSATGPAHGFATMLLAKNAFKATAAQLNPEATGFSDQWMRKVLAQTFYDSLRKAPWSGRLSVDGTSKLFVRSTSTSFGRVTWIDRGVNCVVHVQLHAHETLEGATQATALVSECMERILNLPAVPASAVKVNMKLDATAGRSVYVGTIQRDLKTTSTRASDGRLIELGNAPLRWHNYIVVLCDGANVAFRINFFDAERDVLKRVADPLTRFVSSLDPRD